MLFGSQPFTTDLINSNREWFRYVWEWNKVVGSNFINANKMPLKVFEEVIIFYKRLPTYNPQMTIRDKEKQRPATKQRINPITNTLSLGNATKGKTHKYPTNEIKINRLNNELNSKYAIQPTQKPVALLEYLIKTYTNEGETVLDNCMGSGSTGVACINTNRNFIGIEKDETYFKIAEKRIEEAIADMAGRLF